MQNSTFQLDFGFLGNNHEILSSQRQKISNHDTLEINRENPYDDIINQYEINSVSRFFLRNILFSKKSGIFEVAYIPNISPIDIFMKNCEAEETIWISCHKQVYYIKDSLEIYVVRDIGELFLLISTLKHKKYLIITHLSHIITSHLLAATLHNQSQNSVMFSINDYKCKLITRLFQLFGSKFNKTVLINQFMNSKNNEFNTYMLKTEMENAIIGKGSLDLVWQRLINYKFGIYNSSQDDCNIKVVMETGQSNGSTKVFNLFQHADETKIINSENNNENEEFSILDESKATDHDDSVQDELLLDSQI
ncbi:hypothetical protein QEN19_001748 [Hanseniaspora menglaensis]